MLSLILAMCTSHFRFWVRANFYNICDSFSFPHFVAQHPDILVTRTKISQFEFLLIKLSNEPGSLARFTLNIKTMFTFNSLYPSMSKPKTDFSCTCISSLTVKTNPTLPIVRQIRYQGNRYYTLEHCYTETTQRKKQLMFRFPGDSDDLLTARRFSLRDWRSLLVFDLQSLLSFRLSLAITRQNYLCGG